MSEEEAKENQEKEEKIKTEKNFKTSENISEKVSRFFEG